MKIAIVTSWNVRCGIATYSRDLANALAQENIETYIVRVPRFGVKSAELMVDLANRIPYDKVDLVHVQHEYGIFQGYEAPFFSAIRMHGKPIVTTMHAVGNWEVDAFIARISNKIVVHNKYCADRFSFPSTVIPHGVVSADASDRESAKIAMNINKDAPVVGYLGFISNYKGLETLITAMTKVPNVGLLICGGWHTTEQTNYGQELMERSKKLLGKRVMWTGYIPEDKLADAYGAMDILVYPSRFATESGALLHGIAYGKAILASDLEPFREKEAEGALMTFRDSEDLAKGITVLLKEPARIAHLEKNAKEYARRHSWAAVAIEHVGLYSNLLSGAK